MLWKCSTEYASSGHRTRKGQFLFQYLRKAMPKNAQSEVSEVAQSCPTLRDPMDCSLPGSSIHGIFQATVLKWGAIAFSKECSNYHTIALISHASKIMLKIFQARLQHMWTVNFLMFKLVLEKAEEPEINCQHLLDHRKSKRVPEKHLFLFYWLCQSLWLCGSQ